MPKQSAAGERGRFALLHTLAHIELCAVDMTWDLIARFVSIGMPQLFYDNWVQVGLEEAKHFDMLCDILEQLGGSCGDLQVHAGRWQAAQETKHDLLARLAILPLVLEALGLDVSPEIIAKLEKAEDKKSADILKVVCRNKKKHVAIRMYWFRLMCQRVTAKRTNNPDLGS